MRELINMSNATISIPDELMESVQRRQALWSQFDQSQRDRDALQQLAKDVPTEVQTEPMAALTAEATPDLELHAAVLSLKTSVADIQQLQGAIQGAEDEIAAINNRYRLFIIGIIAAVVILLMFLVVSLMSAF